MNEFYDIPERWLWSKLGLLVLSVSYGYTASSTTEAIGPKFLRITDLQNGSVDWEAVPYCVCDNVENYLLKRGDIVVARTGATTGKNYLLQDFPYSSIFASYLIRLDTSKTFPPEWLSLFMQSPYYWRQITQVKKGIAQPGANASILSGLNIPLPPLNEQKRIVSKIEALQGHSRRAKEALDAVGPLLERFRQSVLAAAFRGDLTREWREKNPDVEPAEVLLERIKTERRTRWIEAEAEKSRAAAEAKAAKANQAWTAADDTKVLAQARAKAEAKYSEPEPIDTSDLPELPKGWCWATVGDISQNNIQTGPFGAQLHRSDFTTEGVPVLAIGNVKWGYIDFEKIDHVTQEKANELSRFILRAGDVLFTRSGTVGRSAVLPQNADGFLMTGHILRIRVDEIYYLSELLFRAFQGEPTMPEQMRILTRGATRSGFNTSLLASIVVAVPPIEEQKAIRIELSRAEEFIKSISSNCDLKDRLDQLDQSILAKAFRGELVPQDPNDEPASVLLERIKAERAAGAAAPKKQPKGKASAKKKA